MYVCIFMETPEKEIYEYFWKYAIFICDSLAKR